MVKIFYGAGDKFIDVTSICIEKLMNNRMITIPAGDISRAIYFTDPIYGVVKQIIIEKNGMVTKSGERKGIGLPCT